MYQASEIAGQKFGRLLAIQRFKEMCDRNGWEFVYEFVDNTYRVRKVNEREV